MSALILSILLGADVANFNAISCVAYVNEGMSSKDAHFVILGLCLDYYVGAK